MANWAWVGSTSGEMVGGSTGPGRVTMPAWPPGTATGAVITVSLLSAPSR